MTCWILKDLLGTSAVGEETPKGAIVIDVRDLKAVTTLSYMNGKSWEENETLVRRIVRRTFIDSNLRDSCKKVLQ